jgi:DNA-binding transcriptional ArsR family regulator
MLEPIFGNGTAEKVLLFLLVHKQAYAREMAQAFSLSISVIQKQLLRLERGNVLASRTIGRTRVFELNPSYPFVGELRALLRRALEFVPARERAPYEPKRARPRATGKPL